MTELAAGGPPAPGIDESFLPAGLTEAQRLAVMAPDPVLCVLAGAGAGKTRVLTLRVARRIRDRSAAASHVLVCTFSRKAAEELRRRLWLLDAEETVRAGTFHRTALHLLRQWAADRGGPTTQRADRPTRCAAAVLEAATGASQATNGGRGPDTARARTPNPSAAQLETEIGWAKARLVAPDAYEAAARQARRRPALGPARVAELYTRYEAERRRRGLLDLDDLLWRCADALDDDQRFAAAVRWRFRHLFVDEMQDVNPAQFRLLTALLGDEPDLCVVGDPNQSVYGWNGADPTLLERLPIVLPGTRVLRLDENHRCSPQVVAVAAAALGLDEGDGDDEAIDGDDADANGRSEGAPGVAPGVVTPSELAPDGPLPRVTAHPTDADEAAWVAREVWRAHRPGRRWAQIAVLARTNAQLSAVADALSAERVPARRAGAEWSPTGDLRAGAIGADERGAWAGGADAQRPGEHEGHGSPARVTGVDVDDQDADAVVLSTFHRAKGLQWPVVFVIGLSDGLVPISMARTAAAREEERRLLYVAMTRAEDELSCSWAAFADDRAEGRGAAPRQPSPWLRAVARRRDALANQEAAPDPAKVAARLAELRARLAANRADLG